MFKRSMHRHHKPVWNRHKLIGQKPPLKLKDIWAIRVRLQIPFLGDLLQLASQPRDFRIACLAVPPGTPPHRRAL